MRKSKIVVEMARVWWVVVNSVRESIVNCSRTVAKPMTAKMKTIENRIVFAMVGASLESSCACKTKKQGKCSAALFSLFFSFLSRVQISRDKTFFRSQKQKISRDWQKMLRSVSLLFVSLFLATQGVLWKPDMSANETNSKIVIYWGQDSAGSSYVCSFHTLCPLLYAKYVHRRILSKQPGKALSLLLQRRRRLRCDYHEFYDFLHRYPPTQLWSTQRTRFELCQSSKPLYYLPWMSFLVKLCFYHRSRHQKFRVRPSARPSACPLPLRFVSVSRVVESAVSTDL